MLLTMHNSLFLRIWVSLECHPHGKVTCRHPSLIGIFKIYLYRFKTMENSYINPLHLALHLNSLERWNVEQRLKCDMLTYSGRAGDICALLQFRPRVGSAPFPLCNLSYSVTHWEKSSVYHAKSWEWEALHQQSQSLGFTHKIWR